MASRGRPVGAVELGDYLKATGWSQSELARRLGVSPSNISRTIKHGKPLGRHVARDLERVSRQAFESGETTVEPIRVSHNTSARGRSGWCCDCHGLPKATVEKIVKVLRKRCPEAIEDVLLAILTTEVAR